MKLIMLLLSFNFSYAANMIDNPELLYQMPVKESNVLGQKVTVNWKFSSLKDFVATLQKNYSVNFKILSNAPKPDKAIKLYLENGSISQLITEASGKFGYIWEYKDDIVIFRAVNPVVVSEGSVSAEQLTWSLKPSDRTLRSTLSRWCKTANWQLVWNVRADYPIATSWVISGSFETAVNEVLKSSQGTDIPLLATMHDSNRVLEITSK